MTSFWAGPLTGHMLALLGAEVIHLESATRPDGARLVGGVPQTEDRYWERGPIFAALNTNKKSLTIDLSEPRGLDLVRRVIGTCDVVVENYTPRVLDQLGLDFESLRAERPDLIVLRMPGFGLDGPGRDLPAFAFVIEDAAGLTWLTGHPDLLPFEPYCVGDPNAGLHALYGLLLALEHRERTGEGGLVEAAMVDAALNIAAEQPIEFSAYGALLERAGNRGPTAAPQNLYQVAGPDEHGRDDAWVAIAVATDEQWAALRVRTGRSGRGPPTPSWRPWPAGCAAHDRIDARCGEWCRARSADEIVDRPVGGRRAGRQGDAAPRPARPAPARGAGLLRGARRIRSSDPPATARCPCASRGDRSGSTTGMPRCSVSTTARSWRTGPHAAEIGALEADGIIGGSLARGT